MTDGSPSSGRELGSQAHIIRECELGGRATRTGDWPARNSTKLGRPGLARLARLANSKPAAAWPRRPMASSDGGGGRCLIGTGRGHSRARQGHLKGISRAPSRAASRARRAATQTTVRWMYEYAQDVPQHHRAAAGRFDGGPRDAAADGTVQWRRLGLCVCVCVSTALPPPSRVDGGPLCWLRFSTRAPRVSSTAAQHGSTPRGQRPKGRARHGGSRRCSAVLPSTVTVLKSALHVMALRCCAPEESAARDYRCARKLPCLGLKA